MAIWWPSINRYISASRHHFCFIDEEEMDYLTTIEKAWREEQKTPSMRELLEIFPEGKQILKRQIVLKKQELARLNKLERHITNVINTKVKPSERWFWWLVANELLLYPREEIQRIIKRYTFLVSARKESAPGKITEDDVARAREVPIEHFVQPTERGTGQRVRAQCPLHTEKTASFTIYRKQNSWYCYGCHEGGDVIDLVMKINNIKFLEAVRRILHL